jgi:ribosomal protein S12 methylthiotransferase accessory factor
MTVKEKTASSIVDAEVAALLGSYAISEKTGIITDCVEMMNESYDPKIFYYTTYMADTSRYPGANKCYTNNGGAGLTRQQAKAAAIGESLERYCSSIYDRNELVYASYNDLAPGAVKPSDWVLFSDKQYESGNFPYKPFHEDVKIYWVEGTSLITGRKIFVPATFVFLPYYIGPGETPIAPSISTGLSAGISWESALLGGIYECVERDAISNMWLNKLSLPTINPFGKSRFFGGIMKEKIATDNARLVFTDITNDIGIPVVFAIKIFKSAKGLSAACGAAARLDSEEAALKAAIEASQGAKWIQYLHMEDWMWGYKDDFSDITEFKHHVKLYSMPENLHRLEFVYSNNANKDLASMPDYSGNSRNADIETCLAMLEKKKFDVIVVDVTSCDIRQIGFVVLKVLIPGLQPLNGDHNYPFLGGKRLYEMPVLMNYARELTDEASINKDPHPFP